jgi:hypothetical protein
MAILTEILANREWLRRSSPFLHVAARDVFTAEFYAALAAQLRAILARGLSETPEPVRFSRNIRGYDCYGIGFDLGIREPLAVFLSLEWRDLLNGIFDIAPTPYLFAGSHHHVPGSGNGFVHNDFNPVWFRQSSAGETRIPDNTLCSYKTGEGSLSSSEKIEVVRGAVVLYFLLNDGWTQGDGGELGLFASGQSPVGEPAALCPPVNNSLVAFECTPRSFHAFLKNTRIPRTSIIMWTHRPMIDALSRWGEDRLERWRS